MASTDNGGGDDRPPAGGAVGRVYPQEMTNSGGMADIWLATDPDGKPFALRRLHDRLRGDWGARRRLFRGCEVLARLQDYDHVIGYVEHGKIGATPYLLMEY